MPTCQNSWLSKPHQLPLPRSSCDTWRADLRYTLRFTSIRTSKVLWIIHNSETYIHLAVMAGTEQAPKGYPALAQLMAAGEGMAIFKRFGEMQVHSLLMQQAELLQLQDRLREHQKRNQKQGNGVNEGYLKLRETEANTAPQHSGTSRPPSTPSKPEMSQWALHLEIKRKLKEYSQ